MPPSRASSVDEMLGRISATVEAMAKRDEEDRAESRDRGKKMDDLLQRVSSLDTQMREKLAHVEDKVREQARDTLDRISHFKHEVNNAAQVQGGRMDVFQIQLDKLERLQFDLKKDLSDVKDDVASVNEKVATVTVDVASVKGDTEKLQGPVGQFIAVRNRVIAWAAAVVSVAIFLFSLFHKAWDDALTHLVNYLFK